MPPALLVDGENPQYAPLCSIRNYSFSDEGCPDSSDGDPIAHILVVDDVAMLREVLRRLRQSAGHDVHEAGSGDEAIRVVTVAPPDLIFCDMFMPDRDGIDTMRALARIAPGIPIVAMSGGGSCGFLDMLPGASRLGAAGTLPKPFEMSTVLRAVECALTSRP